MYNRSVTISHDWNKLYMAYNTIYIYIWRCLINHGLHRGDVTKLSAPIQQLEKICASHCFAKRVKSLGFKWLKQGLWQQFCYHRGDPAFWTLFTWLRAPQGLAPHATNGIVCWPGHEARLDHASEKKRLCAHGAIMSVVRTGQDNFVTTGLV